MTRVYFIPYNNAPRIIDIDEYNIDKTDSYWVCNFLDRYCNGNTEFTTLKNSNGLSVAYDNCSSGYYSDEELIDYINPYSGNIFGHKDYFNYIICRLNYEQDRNIDDKVECLKDLSEDDILYIERLLNENITFN